MKTNYDIVIIGGGPAGLASAISAYDNGVKDILVLEREEKTGGIFFYVAESNYCHAAYHFTSDMGIWSKRGIFGRTGF